MRGLTATKEHTCFWLICLCFFWTSGAYLAWFYRLAEMETALSVDFATEVIGYGFQGLGLLAFALAGRRFRVADGRSFAVFTAVDVLCTAGALLAPMPAAVLACGFAMNFCHGLIAGFYLRRLALTVGWHRRAAVFGFGYAVATIATWLLSLVGEMMFLRSPYALAVIAALALLSVAAAGRGGPLSLADIRFEGEKPSPKLIAVAAATVFLLSFVKGLGFAFPSADVGTGVDLELSRVFYAVSLVIAGIVSDRERRYGAVCCVAALSVPFLMLALADEPGLSVFFWVLNYFIFGFFTLFRVILFVDIARKDETLLWLAGFGLLFGRLGDAAGTAACVVLAPHGVALVVTAAVLFAVTILLFFRLYRAIYLPRPLREPSEGERFDAFADRHELSLRERDVLRLILEGRSNPEIAAALYISESTVKFHIHNLLKKTACENRLSLLARYREERKKSS